MASNRIKGLTIEIGGDTRKLSDELKAVEKDGDRLGKELKEVNNLLKFDPGNTEALAEKQKILAEAIANSNEKLKTLKNSQEQVKAQFESGQIDRGQYLKFCEEIAATEKQTADYAKQLEKVKAAQEQAGNSADKAADNINDAAKAEGKAADNADDMAAKSKKASEAVASLAKNIAKISAAAITAATGAMVGFAKSSVDAGMTFDTSMSQVAATMGTTVDQIGELRDFAQEMGSKTAFSASQAADALNYMALAGYDANQSMDMLPKVLNLAAAGGMELAKASDMITDSQSALGLTSEQTAAMVDQMAAAASKTNTSVTQLGDAILTVGGTAKSLSGGTSELSAVLGVMADNGIKGSEAGTHLRNIMLAMTPTTEDAAAAFEQLGIKAYDEQGNLRNLETIFMELSKSMEGMTDEEKTNALNAIFNKTDLTAVNALLSTTAERWNEVNTALDNSSGAAEAMANTQLDNLAGDITLFKSALEGAQIVVSDQLTPTLREFVQFGTEGVSQLTEAFKSGGLSGAMSSLGGIISDALAMIIDMLPEVINAAASLLQTFVDGIVTNIPTMIPIVIDGGIMLFMGLIDSLQNVSDTLMPMLPDLITDVCDTLTDNIPTLITGAVTLFTGLVLGLGNSIPALIEGVYTVVPQVVAALIENIPAIIECAVQLFVALAQGIPQAIPTVIEGIPTMINAIVDALMGYDWMSLGKELITGVGTGIVEGAKSIGNMVKDAADSMWNGLKSALGVGGNDSNATDTGAEMAENVADGFVSGMNDNKSKISAALPYDHAAEEAAKYAAGVKNYNDSLAAGIAKQQEQTVETYVSTVKAAESSAKKQTKTSTTAAKEVLSEAKKAYDKVLDLYKDGKISYDEYNKQYTDILEKYSTEQVEITEYAQEKMTDVAEKEAEKRVSTLKKSIETEISEYQKEIDTVQKQMESFSGKLTKAYKDVYTFTTDEKTGKISAKTTDVMIKSKKELENYLSDIEALQKRGVSNVMLQQLSDMSKDEGAAVAEYWLSLTDQELKNLQNNWTAYNNVSAKISQAIYADEAKSAAEGMLNAIGETLSESESNLQDSGLMILQGLKQGILNDKGINEIKNLCDGIVSAMTGYFNANAVDVSIGAKILNGNIVPTTASNNNSGGGAGNTYNFTQNNYSPKALSRDDINRDTQRQLQLAGMK